MPASQPVRHPEPVAGMVSYRAKAYTLAAEAALTTDSTTGVATRDGHVYSAFGVYHFPRSGAAVIARVDA